MISLHPVMSDVNFFLFCFLDQMRQYITQLRQETSVRVIDKVYAGGDQPSKVCMCVWYMHIHTHTHTHTHTRHGAST